MYRNTQPNFAGTILANLAGIREVVVVVSHFLLKKQNYNLSLLLLTLSVPLVETPPSFTSLKLELSIKLSRMRWMSPAKFFSIGFGLFTLLFGDWLSLRLGMGLVSERCSNA